LRDYLKEGVGVGWEMEDYGHNEFIIEEYTKDSIGSGTLFTVDWKYDDDNDTTNF
jgi:hypothetical protein